MKQQLFKFITVAISENTQEIDQPIYNNNNKMF